MKIIQIIRVTLQDATYQSPSARLFNELLGQVLDTIVYMAGSADLTCTRICQLHFLMVDIVIRKQKAALKFKNNVFKMSVLRRKHNVFWQPGAGLTLVNEKGLFLHSSSNKEADYICLAA